MKSGDLERHYKDLEARFHVLKAPELGPLVVANGNSGRSFHRWFHLKEAFSSELFEAVLARIGLADVDHLSVIDPFAGVGTTLISALDWASNAKGRSLEVVGIEQNPFLHLAARAKSLARARGPELAPEVRDLFQEVLTGSADRDTTIPELSTFRNSAYLPPSALRRLLQIRAGLDKQPASLAADCLKVALGASIEPISRLRRDGRALRYEAQKQRPNVGQELRRRVRGILKDLSNADSVRANITVVWGDGRRPASAVPPQFAADIAVFSPPYPNNIDYTEVYKLEAWLLGFYDTREAFRSQRKRTLRSHPSVVFPDSPHSLPNELDLSNLLGPLVHSIPEDRYERQRHRMVTGYFEDMAQSLLELRSIMRPGGYLCLVVGNSLHGRSDALLVAADLLLAMIGESLGLRVREILVARRPTRQQNKHRLLRESMIIYES